MEKIFIERNECVRYEINKLLEDGWTVKMISTAAGSSVTAPVIVVVLQKI